MPGVRHVIEIAGLVIDVLRVARARVDDPVGRAEEGRDTRLVDGVVDGVGADDRAGIGPFRGACIAEIHRIVHRHLLQVGRDAAVPGVRAGGAVGAAALGRVPILVQWRDVIHIDVIGDRQRDLLEVVGALRATGRLACRLHRRQEQRDQHGDDRDDDQELDQREPTRPVRWRRFLDHGGNPRGHERRNEPDRPKHAERKSIIDVACHSGLARSRMPDSTLH